MKKVFAFLFVLWGCCICVWSQGGLFFTSDKLSNTNITSICQDKSGYIWIGTENGLNRFDGYKFTVYKNNPQLLLNISDTILVSRIGQVSDYKTMASTASLSRKVKPLTSRHFSEIQTEKRRISALSSPSPEKIGVATQK